MDYGNLKVPENITPEVQAILDRYKTNQDAIQKKHNKQMAKMYGGAALQIGAGVLPLGVGGLATKAIASKLVPYVGSKIAQTTATGLGGGLVGGAVEGFGRGLVEGENPWKTMVSDGAISTLFGGTLGLAGGKIGKVLAEKALTKGNKLPQQYFDEYVAGLLGDPNTIVPGKVPMKNLYKPEENKVIRAQRGVYSGVQPGGSATEFLFAGEKALNTDNVALNKAKELFEQGADNEEIRQLTGWFKGVDDKWRYEIPDGSFNENVNWSNLNDEQSYVPLKNLYNNEALYSAYPEIADLPIVRSPMDWHIKGGAYRYKDSPTINGIMLNKSLFNNTPYGVWKDKIDDIYKTAEGAKWRKNDEDWWNNKISNEEYEKVYDAFFETPEGKLFEKLRDNEPKFTSEFVDEINKEGKKSLLHELQHLIQEKEGFALGGSEEHPRYGHLAGEVESRLAEKRYDLSEIDKKNINPLTQFDVAPEKQVIEFNNNGLYQKLIGNEEFDYNKAKNLAKDLRNGERNPLKYKAKDAKIENISPRQREYIFNEVNTTASDIEKEKGLVTRRLHNYDEEVDYLYTTIYDKDGNHEITRSIKIDEDFYDKP